jgi:PKD repeat protein
MIAKKISVLFCFGLLSLQLFSQVHEKARTVTTESKYEKVKVKAQETPKEKDIYSDIFPGWLEIRTESSSRCPKDKIEFILNKEGYLSYEWDFGDGSFASSASPRSSHIFNKPGSYIVSCLIKDKNEMKSTKKLTVVILACK